MAKHPSWGEYFLQIIATRSSYKRLKVGLLICKKQSYEIDCISW